MNKIEIFTDGASRGNPGPGGWGAVVIFPDSKTKELGGREENTTNNRMELSAILSSLIYVEERKSSADGVVIYTDSAYAANGILGWMYSWEKKGWKTAAGEKVLNQDLWEKLLGIVFRIRQMGTFEVKKVEGHSGLLGNDRADLIATSYADENVPLLFSGSLDDYQKILGGTLHDVAPSAKKVRAGAYSYVSLVGGVLRTHRTWEECEVAVKGVSGAKWKKSLSKEDEQKIIREWAGV